MSAWSRIGDRTTGDVVVRLLTQDGQGRFEHIYCHSHILVEKSKYFAFHLSEKGSTSQTIDKLNCAVHCQESDFDHYVSVLRLLYVDINGSVDGLWNSVQNALDILPVAVELGCPQIVTACVNYLAAVPWGATEEKNILKTVRRIGSEAKPILARLEPVDPKAIMAFFRSAIQFATSSPPPNVDPIKYSAQAQVEDMLDDEDEDALLLTADDEIKYEVKECVRRLLAKFNNLLDSLSCEPGKSLYNADNLLPFESHIGDLSWACKILTKLEIMSEFVNNWTDASEKIVKAVEEAGHTAEMIDTMMKVIELAIKVLEAIQDGKVILSDSKRVCLVKAWLPFVKVAKPLFDSLTIIEKDDLTVKLDNEQWECLEATFVSIILTLPSADEAEILTQWWGNRNIKYPDLREVSETWIYRSKVAKRRLA